jgi:hypothetical protein
MELVKIFSSGSQNLYDQFYSTLKNSFIRSTSIQVVILDLNWYENAFLKSNNKMSWADLIRPLIVEHKITYHKRSFIRQKSLVQSSNKSLVHSQSELNPNCFIPIYVADYGTSKAFKNSLSRVKFRQNSHETK